MDCRKCWKDMTGNKKRLLKSLLYAARCGQTISDESLFALTL